jgi:PIH1 N-terminal domain
MLHASRLHVSANTAPLFFTHLDAPVVMPSGIKYHLKPSYSVFCYHTVLFPLIAGICLKTRTVAGEKVFLNLCTSEEIPQTKDVSEIELAQILNSDDPSTYRVPMSLGEGRIEKDKS